MDRRRVVYPLVVIVLAALVWFFGREELRPVRPVLRPPLPSTGSGADTISPAPGVPAPLEPPEPPEVAPAGR